MLCRRVPHLTFVLTSFWHRFCQLGALRLGARRAMMFFFDSNYAYILAEATRTLSLLDDSVHEIDDALW